MSSYRTPKSGSHFSRPPNSSVPSILKKQNNPPPNNVPKRKVQINVLENLKALLINFNQNNEKEKLQYNNLICDIRDAGIEIKVSLLTFCFSTLVKYMFRFIFIIKYVGNS